MGAALASVLTWLRDMAPYLYDGLLILLGKEWQRKIDEAKAERARRQALEQEMEDTRRANEQAAIVEKASHAQHYGSSDNALERLREFWNRRT